MNDLVRIVDLIKKCFQKEIQPIFGHLIIQNYRNYKRYNTELQLDGLPERYNEALLKTTKLTVKENISVMKKFKLN